MEKNNRNDAKGKHVQEVLSFLCKWIIIAALFVVSYSVGSMSAAYVLSYNAAAENSLTKYGKADAVVLIDPGHGGIDPGKIGIDGTLEKDVNLAIALRLKSLLEQNNIKVHMTRQEDVGLYDMNDSNKKVQDLKNRVAMAVKLQPDITVSIHQNSYPEECVKGAQLFYYENSEESLALAEILQETLRELDLGNTRQAKSNSDYYLLKKTPGPIVIAECGFLSNEEEAGKLRTEIYQEKIAWKLHLGILRYLLQRKK